MPAFLVAAGAATLIPQSELTVDKLAAELQPLLCSDREELCCDRASRARALAKPHGDRQKSPNLCLSTGANAA